ncbi:hypothetical protein SmJEL517_g02855 [Synchytrium microbalum]|uniref:Uncharacterized protein n=1 Tax=Synchytrium microbalum TaxID=1806994 RepID=A0A507C654_9FUNG|nr:uncharacterized protein SmJEL517_g02855 [Synchytrium microbalum]TPX34589.1 hypothetical protein SmJEL517_g02855 [Synchytrium microbalum]
MVQIQVKQAEDALFLFETTAKTPISELLEEIVKLCNRRLQLLSVIQELKRVIHTGPMQIIPSDNADEDDEDEEGQEPKLSPPEEKDRELLEKVAANSEAVVSKDLIPKGHVLTLEKLNEAFSDVTEVCMGVFPSGLPAWEPLRMVLEGNISDLNLNGKLVASDTSLWWASKELQVDKKLSDYVGVNEKTKIVAKLQKKGSSAPVKEAPLDEMGQRNLMAYYYRKQEEHKKLMENEDDEYLSSTWADSKSLKSAFNGMASISLGPRK